MTHDNRLNAWYYLLKTTQSKDIAMTTDNTYILWAYNEESVYAYGCPSDADSYCEYLNTDRAINLYGVAISDLTAKQLENTINLADELAAI